jgi:hypothetical protein
MSDTGEMITEKTDMVFVKDRQRPAMWRTRAPAWVILSWCHAAPRLTVRLDGYYFVRVMAEGCAASGRHAGRVALVLELPPATAAVAIPDELFEVAVLDPIKDMPDAQRGRGRGVV